MPRAPGTHANITSWTSFGCLVITAGVYVCDCIKEEGGLGNFFYRNMSMNQIIYHPHNIAAQSRKSDYVIWRFILRRRAV